MLTVTHYDVQLQLTTPGPLLPWLGPAVRGIVALRLKDRVCRLSADQRQGQGPYCVGCVCREGCPYGETFEPAWPPDVIPFSGQQDAPPAIVLAPYYPVPLEAEPGLEVPVQMTLVGTRAAAHAGQVLEALAEGGREDGLGVRHVRFAVSAADDLARTDSVSAADLPASPDALPARIPRLGVGLVAPLFLRREVERGGRGRHDRRPDRRATRHVPIRRPEFRDLFPAALRAVALLFRQAGEPLPVDFAALKAAAQGVRMIEHCYEPFQQRKWTSRGDQRYDLQGCDGGGVYADVPLALLPWMVWAGRLRVGSHRVAGAGGWRLILD